MSASLTLLRAVGGHRGPDFSQWARPPCPLKPPLGLCEAGLGQGRKKSERMAVSGRREKT